MNALATPPPPRQKEPPVRPTRLNFLPLLACLTAATAHAQSTPPPPPPPDLDIIQRNLGNADFQTRQAAQHQLESLPADQFWQLHHVIDLQPDPEIKGRLAQGRDQLAHTQLWTQAKNPGSIFPHHITGRVIDTKGQPIPAVKIIATSGVLGSDSLVSDYTLSALTNDNGQFDLRVPVDGILYYIVTKSDRHADAHQTAFPSKNQLPDWTIQAQTPSPRTIQGTLADENGAPLPNYGFTLLSDSGHAYHVISDTHGTFDFTPPSGCFEHGVALAPAGEKTFPLTMIQDPTNAPGPVKLVLTKSAAAAGVVRDNTGPIAGATVLIRPNFTTGFLLTAVTNDKGEYRVSNIPPGKYIVTAGSPAHTGTPPHTNVLRIPPTSLEPGVTTTVNITVQRTSAVYGQVVDSAQQPVPRALVAVRATSNRNSDSHWRTTLTDAQGHFLLGTDLIDETPALFAFSSLHGLAQIKLQITASGQSQYVRLQLPGARHVKGTITDLAGRPLSDIACMSGLGSSMTVHSNEQGAFDLGQISLAATPKSGPKLPTLYIICPRPSSPNAFKPAHSFSGALIDIPNPQNPPQFFLHKEITPDPARADALNITLEPAQLVSLSGTARNADGTPLPNADVYLFSGDTDPKGWLELLLPITRTDDGTIGLRGLMLAAVHTDGRGQFTLWTINGDPVFFLNYDLSKFAILLIDKTRHTFLQNIQVEKTAASRDVDLRLSKDPIDDKK